MDAAVCQVIKQNMLFSGIDLEAVSFRKIFYPRGSVVSSSYMGEAAVGIVVEGRVQVFSISPDGSAANISTLGPGDCFGISTVFTGTDLTTSLEADRNSLIAYIMQKKFLALLESNPKYLINYACFCNRKLQYLAKKIELLVSPSCRARLAAYLLENAAAGAPLHLGVPKDRLAQMLCVSRASLFRELQILSKQGIIKIDGKIIHIKNPKALRDLLNN